MNTGVLPVVLLKALLEGPAASSERCFCSRRKDDHPGFAALALANEDIVLRCLAILDEVAGVATELAAGFLLLPGSSQRCMGFD